MKNPPLPKNMSHSTITAEYIDPSREPISQNVLQYAANLAERAGTLADRIGIKLMPIRLEQPSCANGASKVQDDYPEYFTHLRLYFDRVTEALNTIDHYIDEVEF